MPDDRPAGRFLPRDRVHERCLAIDGDAGRYRAAFLRIRRTRPLRWIDRAGFGRDEVRDVARYQAAVAVLVLEGEGRLRSPSRHDLEAAEERIARTAPELAPVDDGWLERARRAPRAQPHLLDEVLDALFVWPGPTVLRSPEEKLGVYLAVWVVVEALDTCWTPARTFVGDPTYVYVPTDPYPPEPLPEPEPEPILEA